LGVGIADHQHRRLQRTHCERPSDHRSAKRGYEIPPYNADCHLPVSKQDHARCNVGKNITPQDAGLWPSRAPTGDDWRGGFRGYFRRPRGEAEDDPQRHCCGRQFALQQNGFDHIVTLKSFSRMSRPGGLLQL
jgi:hypothetical protein